MPDIGQRIIRARRAAGLSKSELGRRIGSGYQTVHAIEELGQQPTLDTLRRLAAALDLAIAELIGQEDQP